jgi:hypothetical protein
MFNGLINVKMLSRGTMLLAPIFMLGLLTGNPIWFRVELVTVSIFIAAERSHLAPFGVLLHALVVSIGFLALTLSLRDPELFVIASMMLTLACMAVTAAGSGMRATGTFTFIPVLYLACVTANDAKGRELAAGLQALPYLLWAALPVIVDSVIRFLPMQSGGSTRRARWYAIRKITEMPSPGWLEGTVAGALAVGVAASFVEWEHIHYAQWLIWSAASVVTGDTATARAKCKDRLAGASIGVPAGMLVRCLMPHAPLLLDVLPGAAALTLVGFNRYVVAFGTRCALHAVIIIVAGRAVLTADARAINVIVGSGIGIVFVLGTDLLGRSLKGILAHRPGH